MIQLSDAGHAMCARITAARAIAEATAPRCPACHTPMSTDAAAFDHLSSCDAAAAIICVAPGDAVDRLDLDCGHIAWTAHDDTNLDLAGATIVCRMCAALDATN